MASPLLCIELMHCQVPYSVCGVGYHISFYCVNIVLDLTLHLVLYHTVSHIIAVTLRTCGYNPQVTTVLWVS